MKLCSSFHFYVRKCIVYINPIIKWPSFMSKFNNNKSILQATDKTYNIYLNSTNVMKNVTALSWPFVSQNKYVCIRIYVLNGKII